MCYEVKILTLKKGKQWLGMSSSNVPKAFGNILGMQIGFLRPNGLQWLAYILGWAEKPKILNINLNQMGSNGTHKNKTYLSKEKNSKVHIRIGKCIWKNRQPPLKSKIKLEKNHCLW